MLILCISCHAFQSNFSGNENEKITEISKLVLQSTVTGIITFAGLFLTIYSQDNSFKKKEQMQLCACLIIKNSCGTSASKDISSIISNPQVIICCEESQLRTVECVFVNCKNNYALNLSLVAINGEVKLGTIKDDDLHLQLALKEEKVGRLIFNFEDIYGLKYRQKIVYEYQQYANEFQFISHQPKRRFL